MYHNDPRESEDAGGSPRMPLKALAAVIGYAIMQPALYSSRFHAPVTNEYCLRWFEQGRYILFLFLIE